MTAPILRWCLASGLAVVVYVAGLAATARLLDRAQAEGLLEVRGIAPLTVIAWPATMLIVGTRLVVHGAQRRRPLPAAWVVSRAVNDGATPYDTRMHIALTRATVASASSERGSSAPALIAAVPVLRGRAAIRGRATRNGTTKTQRTLARRAPRQAELAAPIRAESQR